MHLIRIMGAKDWTAAQAVLTASVIDDRVVSTEEPHLKSYSIWSRRWLCDRKLVICFKTTPSKVLDGNGRREIVSHLSGWEWAFWAGASPGPVWTRMESCPWQELIVWVTRRWQKIRSGWDGIQWVWWLHAMHVEHAVGWLHVGLSWKLTAASF